MAQWNWQSVGSVINMMNVIFQQMQIMARIPNSNRDATHERIVAAAARAIRLNGYAGVGVADVMKQAGLTHGGFYAHFESREALLVEALERAGQESSAVIAESAQRAGKGISAFRSFVETYLADGKIASLATGCPVAALAGEIPRQSPMVRRASARRVQRLIFAVRATLPEKHRAAASVIAGTLAGSLQLARALGDNSEGRALLAGARRTLIQQYDGAATADP
jgi:TetR/AcrR family transcriptional regulator, transcriptional repressor for nem operon